ncbi:MAG: diguanylate cyclase [Sulfurisoma sp.]|nr:diguanylate cyclase [Sulfurisoma sp.]
MGSVDIAKFEQLKTTGDLPSPKGAALAIIRLLQREDVSLVEVARTVKTDPAFVGRLIRAANGINVGGRRAIVSIHDALVVLGIPATRSLALSFSLLSGYRSGNCRNFDYKRFWSHSLACAVALQWLTLRTRAAPPEEAFAVGLLANIGRLGLATMFPNEYSRLLEQAKTGAGIDLLELEQQALVMTHNELSAALMHDWGLPRSFTEPVFHCERPDLGNFVEGSRQFALAWSLALANHIADMCLTEEPRRRALMPDLMLLGSRLSMDAETLYPMCDKVAAEWRTWAAELEVESCALPPFGDLSLAPNSPPVGAVAGAEQGLRILVVDDEASVRALLVSLLRGEGHEVFEASNGRQAFEIALDLRPHIMVADWMMPEMDGIEMTRALRQTKMGRGIYILIVTSFEDDERLIEAFEAGVDDFVGKPIKPRVLSARLRGARRVVQLQQEVERDREEIRRFAAELSVSNRRLQTAALTDPLTGLPNRRYAVDRFQQDWAAAVRKSRSLACLVIDIDDFKTINDTHGHDVGDAVLQQTVAALKKGLRTQDTLARMGGDEFMVICPDTTMEAALTCGERLRHLVESASISSGVATVRGRISVGVAVRESGMADIDALIKCADQGLYLAKQGGRNCVASPQTPPSK